MWGGATQALHLASGSSFGGHVASPLRNTLAKDTHLRSPLLALTPHLSDPVGGGGGTEAFVETGPIPSMPPKYLEKKDVKVIV